MTTIVTLSDEAGGVIQFLIDEDTSYIEHGFQPKGDLPPTVNEDVEKSFGECFDPIRRLADQLAIKIGEVQAKPSEVEVTVGVKVTAEAGVLFAKAGADAEMTVKLVWKDSPKA